MSSIYIKGVFNLIVILAANITYSERLLSEAGNAEDKYLVNLKPVEDIFQCCGATHETRNRYPDCFTVISDWLESTGEAIIVIDVFLLIIELFALISTCILCKAFRYERPYYYA
ncbi:unnamed protein product [Thelazia callipaeda]|uniref:Tetraspanin n=1 Tax=Thelazia callipaeda TaxID=103827 RepID=A0A0N5CT31_THECL|nr:unnamed protein product [Thelazia callipaeda]